MIRVCIEIVGDDKLIWSIRDSLHPDNIVTPQHMRIYEVIDRGMYKIIVESVSSSKGVGSVRQAVDEILAMITLFLRAKGLLKK